MRVLNRGGAGEPPGEPAPSSEILESVSDEPRRQLPDEVVDELLAGARTEEEIVGPGGLLSQLTKRLVERVLEVELTDHLGYERHQEPPGGTGNQRNGSTPKTLLTAQAGAGQHTPRPERQFRAYRCFDCPNPHLHDRVMHRIEPQTAPASANGPTYTLQAPTSATTSSPTPPSPRPTA